MGGEGQRRETGGNCLNRQFLTQLADQSRLRSLAGLDLAAGEFPKPAHRFAIRPLRQQDPPIGVNQGDGGNQDNRLGRRLSCGSRH